MKAPDKIQQIDELPVNQELARRALPVLVGLLCHPEAAASVRDAMGEWLALPKRGLDYRADSFTRTVWAAVVELLDGARPLHPATLDSQVRAVAARETKGLLGEWTDEHVQALRNARVFHAPDMGTASEVVTLAADWACEAVRLCELAPLAGGLQDALVTGAPVDIADLLARMQSSSARCTPGQDVPICNLADLFDAWETGTTVDKVESHYAALDKVAGGFDVGATLIVGRSNDGKTAALLGFMTAQVFPQSTAYENKHDPFKRLGLECKDNPTPAPLDPARPYCLFLSVEMPERQIIARIAASLMLVDNKKLLRKDKASALEESTIKTQDVKDALRAHGRVSLLDAEALGSLQPLAVCTAIASWAMKIRAMDPEATLVVCCDYLQYLDRDPTKDDYSEINAAMRMLTQVSEAHRIVSLIGVQAADGPHPTKRGDIRASKGVIDDAMAVLIVRRHPELTRFTLFNDKARAGARGWETDLFFEGCYGLLTDPDPSKPAKAPHDTSFPAGAPSDASDEDPYG